MTHPDPTIVCVEDGAEADADGSRLNAWFSQVCAHANAFVSERVACRYQIEAARTGRFQVPCPFDPMHDVSCYETAIIQKTFAFHFRRNGENFWLIASEVSDAYRIAGCFFPTRNLYLTLTPRFRHSVPTWNSVLGAIEREPSDTAPDHVGSTLWIGHANYAHFFWNQLPALIALEDLDRIAVETIVVTHEPILPIDRLVEIESRAAPVHRSMSYIRANRGLHPGLVFAMGSTLVTERTKRRLTERCRLHADDLPPFERRGTVIWASLRLRDRHATNIADALLAICHKLDSEAFEATVLLDGFSEPNDIAVPDRYDLTLNTLQRRAIRDLARTLTARVRASRFRHVTVVDIAHLDTPAAIAAGRHADFYFCHHGTQQHKVGWVYDIPGIVHANRSITGTHPGHWMQFQCNGSHRPIYVPEDLITDRSPKTDLQLGNPYYHDYEFRDLTGLAEFFFRNLKEQLPTERTSGEP